MPRKASGRKTSARKSGKKSPTAAERSAQRQTGKEIPDAPQGSDIERIQAKNSNPAHRAPSEQTARLNAASQTSQNSTEQDAKPPREQTPEELRKVQEQQGPSGHPLGSVKAPKPNLNKAVAKVQGQTKILREKGTPGTQGYKGPVVQQGGGGAVKESGDPIR
jgi:hypothetical protein